ncbi:MAG: hypothetical protein AAGE86_12000 [Pseudomonadota bacterium]
MEFITPFMLFILGWHPDRPGELDLQRPEVIFTSEEDCLAAGKKMAERMSSIAATQSGARYEFRCMPIPDAKEFSEAFGDKSEPKR